MILDWSQWHFMVQCRPLKRRLLLMGGVLFALDMIGVAMSEKNQTSKESKDESSQVTNLATANVEVIEAGMVRMHQSAAQEITADEVSMQLSIGLDIATAEVVAHESALGLVNAKTVDMTNSAAGAVRSETVNVVGSAGAVIAGTAHMGNTYAGVVAGRDVRGERIETLILLGNHVEGTVQTVVDTRGALIAGMVGGLLTGIILLIGRLVFGRRS